MSDDNALLLQYARRRDAEAFAELVKRYSGLVFSVARRVTNNVAAAEDVTQDCFIKLARQSAEIRGSLPAWLHRVALNRSMEVMRSEATRQRHEIQSTASAGADRDPTWKQIMPHVDAAMEDLPEHLREPLVQHSLLGRTQNQVAENLGVNQATVSRRIQEGIERIRRSLRKAGLYCTTVALTASFVNDTSAAVPPGLSVSLAKMAIAGPGKTAAGLSITAILLAKAKLIAAIAALTVVGGVLTYGVASLMRKESFKSALHLTPRPYLSNLVLKGDGYAQDSFSLAFQAAAKALGKDADYETVYALSTNAFSPAIMEKMLDEKAQWHVCAWLGDKGMHTLCARYGLAARKLDIPDSDGNAAAICRSIAPVLNQEMDAGNVVLAEGGWESDQPLAGIITDAKTNGAIFGAMINGRLDNRLERPHILWSIARADTAKTTHDLDIATIRAAVDRIRGEPPFRSTPESVYGLKAMDAWIKSMSEIPGFCSCIICRSKIQQRGNVRDFTATSNVITVQAACASAASYLRRIAPDFPTAAKQRLRSAAMHYDRIMALLAPSIAANTAESYANIIGDLSKQKAHVAKVLIPVKSEYAAIAHDLELAVADMKP
jgi:RNA polymerase sigma factor (sigma-70 family)